MALTKQAQETYAKVFGKEATEHPEDPELFEILQNEIFGEIFNSGVLDIKKRELITVVVLTCIQTLPQLKTHVDAALQAGNSALEVREAIYQCAGYIGYPKAINAIQVANQVFKENGYELPLANARAIDYEERDAAGAAIQIPRYGDEVKAVFAKLPGEFGTFVPHLLTAVGFGDFATRSVLSDAEKELVSLLALVAIGAATQIKPHIAGAIKAGNTIEEVTAALVQALPYIGFPYALSALMQVAHYDPSSSSEAYR